jgi:hypothetical protein
MVAYARLGAASTLFHTDPNDLDLLNGRSLDKVHLTGSFRDFLYAHRPEVVHFQHALRLGYETIRITRNTLPQALILYTLHEFMPICHRQGLMIRTEESSAARRPRTLRSALSCAGGSARPRPGVGGRAETLHGGERAHLGPPRTSQLSRPSRREAIALDWSLTVPGSR